MRTVLFIIVAAIVCIAAAWWISALPGEVTMTIAGTTIQTSTPVAVGLLIVLFALLYLVVRLLALLLSIPRRHGRWQQGRRRAKGELSTHRALIALAADDPRAAMREADRSRRLLGDTPLTLLLAAQAGRSAGHDEDAAALFETMSKQQGIHA